ncbi:phage N-6-adenine-methyltransferase [compost metagenome]
MAGLGMGGHHSPIMLKDEWLTPPEILRALGGFDLDPCAPHAARRPWEMAARHYSLEDNGLAQPWDGRVWLNPPYGRETARWLDRLADHGDGVALIFARTETDMFFRHVWGRADAVLFLRGRLHFHHADGKRAGANAGAPSCLVAYGRRNADQLANCGLDGHLVEVANG